MEFTGKISEIRPVRSGETAKGEWANVEFEVTESNPNNPSYPQIGLFDYFKNGEYVKYAKEFADMFKVGDEVTVEFNLGKTVYDKKDGTGKGSFYKTSAWKVTKLQSSSASSGSAPVVDEEEDLGLPF